MAGEIVLGYDGRARARRRRCRPRSRSRRRSSGRSSSCSATHPRSIGGDVADLRRCRAGARRAVHRGGGGRSRTALDPSVEVEVELVDHRPAEAILRGGRAVRRARDRRRRDRRRTREGGAARLRHLSGGTPLDAAGRGGPRARRRLTPHRAAFAKRGYVTASVDDRLLADPGCRVPVGGSACLRPVRRGGRRGARARGATTPSGRASRPRSDRPRRAPWCGG